MPLMARIARKAKQQNVDKETLDVLSDPELMRQIRASEASIARGERGFTFEQVFGEPLHPRKRKKRR